MKRLVMALAFFVSPAPIAAAENQVTIEIAKCAALKDGIARLACFDDLASKEGVDKPSVKRETKGKWRVSAETSKIDDSKNVFLNIKSREQVGSGYKRGYVDMFVACRENTTSVLWNFPMFITTNQTTATLRVDKQKARDQRFSMSTDYQAFGFWSGGTAIPFVRSMYGKQALLVQVTPHGENPILAEFEVAGLREAIIPLAKACNWSVE